MNDAGALGQPEYLDFELQIGRGQGRQHAVTVVRSPAGEAHETMRFPFDKLALEGHLKDLQIALLRSSTRARRLPSAEADAVRQFGQALLDAMLTGSVRGAYDQSLFQAKLQGKRLRLRLRIEEPELAALPWEFLFDQRQGEYAALTRSVSIVRYLEMAGSTAPLTVTLPLRILALVASPSNLPQLDITNEQQRVETATASLQQAGLVEITWLEAGSTWRNLQRAMRGGPWHIFHFIGHGGFDPTADEGILALADDAGKAQLLKASQVGRLLADHPSLRLVLLNACEGARGGEHDLFSSTAATLVQRGIPAVVAMQYEITDEAAIEFSRSLYEALADSMPVDAAVAEARIGVSLALQNTLEWGTPVLFMRSADGLLFKPAGKRESSTTAPQPDPTVPPQPDPTEAAAARTDLASTEQPVASGDGARQTPQIAPVTTVPMPAPTNLPVSLTSFVGRTGELAEVEQLLNGSRLLTLTGVGGAGKTRLALQAAANRLHEFPAGAWLVELATCIDSALLLPFIAAALDVQEETGRPLQMSVVSALRTKTLLLVLDNCEQIVRACAEIVDNLLHACPGLHILATSREALGIAGEAVWRVPSLSFPDVQNPLSTEALRPYDAVQLFVERAATAQSQFSVTNRNAPAVAQICQRLDGIPLALELAAARVKVLTVEQIAARLNDSFRLLIGGSRTALPRQQTLRAAMDWSYELLSAAEQRLLQRLSVFAGGCDLEAVEAVCAGDGIDVHDVLDLLTYLVDKSLVQMADEVAGMARYSLLETVRQYGREKLQATGDEPRLRDRHLDWCLKLAESLQQAKESVAVVHWLDRLEVGLDNLRAALDWSVTEDGREEAGLRLAGALGDFWRGRDRNSEGRRWLESLLSRPSEVTPVVRAKAVLEAGVIAFNQGDFASGRIRLEESLELYRAVGDRTGIAHATAALGYVAGNAQDLTAAQRLLEESLAMRRELGDKRFTAESLSSLAFWTGVQGNHEAARAYQLEALAIQRELGDRASIAASLNALAERVASLSAAESYHQEALALWRELGSETGPAESLAALGRIAMQRGELAAAHRYLDESLTLLRTRRARRKRVALLERLGELGRWEGDYPRAQTLCEEAARILHELENRWGLVWHLFDSVGMLALAQGQYTAARKACEDAVALAREIGTKWGTTWSLDRLAQVALEEGDLTTARGLREECLVIMRSLGSESSVTYLLDRLADVLLKQGDRPAARKACDEALAYVRQGGLMWQGAYVLRRRGEVARAEGDHANARALYEESLLLCRKEGISPGMAASLDGLGLLAREQGNYVEAVAFLRQSLTMYQTMGLRRDVVECLEKLAPAFAGQGELERAARLFGAAAALRKAFGAPLPVVDKPDYEREIAATRTVLDQQGFQAAWTAGERLDADAAIALACEDAPVNGSPEKPRDR